MNNSGANSARDNNVLTDVTDSSLRREVSHVSVCVCTYKRPALLKRLLTELSRQETDDLFTYSVVVADNDDAGSARAIVSDFRSQSSMPIKYCIEPMRGIAHARNRVVGDAEGQFLAFIDDDEFPSTNWLRILFRTCNEQRVDGVFGPVRRHFDEIPPSWVLKSRFYDRRVEPTGKVVHWQEARTGNVLLKRAIIGDDPVPFRTEFRVGEDQDFFRRKMAEGRVFIWCADAEAFEVVPPARWERSYLVKKALLRGASAALQPSCTVKSIAKSVVAVPLYALTLPFSVLIGQHCFMTLLVRMCDHLGKLLALVGLEPIKEAYVSERPNS